METVRDPRVKGKEIALALGRSGRGSTISSATRQLDNMYKSKVSFKPHLILNDFEGYERWAFFCRKNNRRGAASIFFDLHRMLLKCEISSVMYLAGNYDFFITTRNDEINLKSVGLEVHDKTRFYDPIFSIPHGWKYPMKKCIRNFLDSDFVKKRSDRKNHGTLNWGATEWGIYRSIRSDLRKPFKSVGEDAGISSNTAKKSFYNNVLPCCTVANYFFPLGYKYYDKIFIKLESEYEKGLISSLKKFPCTTYVYRLDNEVIFILFHENIRDIFILTKKIEEVGLAKDLLLSVPLASAP